MHFNDSIKITYQQYNKHSISNGREQCLDRTGTQIVWEGELVSVRHLGQFTLLQTNEARPASFCTLTPPSQRVGGDGTVPAISALQKARPSADEVPKYWEIQMFLIGQLSNVLPQCDIKKKRGEIIL